jgi:hypothetical protein
VTGGAPDACLGRLEDTLPEEGEAGPPITLALHELEAMDMACRDPVAPLQGVPGLEAVRSSCSPRAKRPNFGMPLWVASAIHASRSSPRR